MGTLEYINTVTLKYRMKMGTLQVILEDVCIPEEGEPKVLYIQYLKMDIFKIILYLKINTPLNALGYDDPEVYL